MAQSGGPTCAINASLVGVFREALKDKSIDAIFGSINGIEGMISNHLIDMKSMISTNEDGASQTDPIDRSRLVQI